MNLCTDCKHCIAPESGLPAANWAKCAVTRTDPSPVDGTTRPRYCEFGRMVGPCGPLGVLFVPKGFP